MKFILITGGVMSGLGKVCLSSLSLAPIILQYCVLAYTERVLFVCRLLVVHFASSKTSLNSSSE
jgi:hypothetical protein